MAADEITFRFPSVNKAISALEVQRARAAKYKSFKASLAVSRGNGADGLDDLAEAVAVFAAALENEIAEGKAWLESASSEFDSKDQGLAKGFSSGFGGR